MRKTYFDISVWFLVGAFWGGSGIWTSGRTQSVFVPLNQDYYALLDRYEIKANQHLSAWNTQLKPYPRSVIAHQADSVWANLPQLSAADRFNLQYFQMIVGSGLLPPRPIAVVRFFGICIAKRPISTTIKIALLTFTSIRFWGALWA
ncbi:MAG: hypothetical protein HC913_10230 [Microscillaceae bacterium]|nr:hypothetical protein [Microscillaceae bacterium]